MGSLEQPSDRAVGGDHVEERVLLAGVHRVLVLDDADLGEAFPEPTVAGVEQPELLAVRDDLGEQRGLERVAALLAEREQRLR